MFILTASELPLHIIKTNEILSVCIGWASETTKQLWLEAVRSVEVCVVLMHFAHASKKAHFGVKCM